MSDAFGMPMFDPLTNKEIIESLRREVEELRVERNMHLNNSVAFSEQLAASQAREVVLRDAVQHLIVEAKLTSSQYEICRQALATPPDNTALIELCDKAREQAAVVCDSFQARDASIDPAFCAGAIRFMKGKLPK